jgi:hypothetical protein
MSEKSCGIIHNDIEEAIRHARRSLACVDSEPYWALRANRNANFGNVIGYQTVDKLKRWRLDYDEKGAHVNEEDFTCTPARKVRHDVHPFISKDLMVTLFWQKWTRRYDKPPELLEREALLKKQKEG